MRIRLLLLLGLVGAAACAGPRKESKAAETSFFLEQAEFFTTDFDKISADQIIKSKDSQATGKTPIFPVQFHWIKPGKGVVFVVRQFSEGTPAVDDEEYLKLTIWLKDAKVGHFSFEKHDQGLLLLSKGSSVWPRASCIGSPKSGDFTISKVTSNEIVGKINVDVSCKHIVSGEASNFSLKQEFAFKRLPTADLTPWIGKKGQVAVDEMHP